MKSLLLTQQTLLNATKNELSSKTSASVDKTLKEISGNLAELRTLIDGGVEKLLQMEVECFTRVNLTVCGDIIGGHMAFRSLLQDISEHHAQAEYLHSILTGRASTVAVLQEKLLQVSSELTAVNAMISDADTAETADSIDARTNEDTDIGSCPDEGQVRFSFDSRSVDTIEACMEEEDVEEEEEGGSGASNKVECLDVEVPANSTINGMWNVHSCPIESELMSFGILQNFTQLMNSVPLKVSASLLKVEVHRPWFQEAIFEDSEHFTMVSGYL